MNRLNLIVMKRFLLFISLITVSIVYASQVKANVIQSSEPEKFSGGEGTEESPYIINTIDDFIQLASDVNNGTSYEGIFFKVSRQEIDFSGVSFPGIGIASYLEGNFQEVYNPFSGHFDGNNVVIKNLHSSQGIFGSLETGAVVTGIVVDSSCEIKKSGGNVGGIVGLSKGTVSNCINKASIIAGGIHIGGICGDCMGTITNCKNFGEITVSRPQYNSGMIGGISGVLDGGTISNCENYGNVVTGINDYSDEIGGIVGLVTGSYAGKRNIIDGCINKGNVTGTNTVGGVFGSLSTIDVVPNTINNNLVKECVIYSTGTSNVRVGAIFASGIATYSNNYYTDDVVVKSYNTTFNGLMARAYCYYPSRDNTMRGENIKKYDGGMIKFSIEDYLTSYSDSSYEIKSVEDMKTLKDLINEVGLSLEGFTFKVTAIELDFKNVPFIIGQYCTRDEYYNYNPTYKPFSGVFDGNGVVIKNLKIEYNSSDYNYNRIYSRYGLFAYNKGIVKNVVIDENCSASYGGLVGVNEGEISGCIIKSTYANGGIAHSNSGLISNNLVINNLNKQIPGSIAYTNDSILYNNLYYSQIENTTATGTSLGDITDDYGAVHAYTLSADNKTVIENKPLTGLGIITYNDITYYANGLTINIKLNYPDEIPEGYELVYYSNESVYYGSDKRLTPNEDGTYDFTIKNKNIVVKDSLEPLSYNIIYYVDGIEYRSQEYRYNSIVYPISEPRKDNYTFSGWNGIPDTMPARDVTVTGTFTFTGRATGQEIDNIYYNIDATTNEAEVTSNPNKYSGDVVIPSSITYEGTNYPVSSISASAFEDCGGLTSIVIPSSVTSIGDYAFEGCHNLKSIEFPNSLTSIGNSAFYLTGLISITIPNSVIHIGTNAFDSCWKLESIVVDPDNPVYDSRDNCNALIETESNTLLEAGINLTTIPDGIVIIGMGAYDGNKMTSIDLPKSVTTIQQYAFASLTNATTINLSENISLIDEGAFYKCTSLTDVYCYAKSIPEAKTGQFDNIFYDVDLSKVTLHVPIEMIESYKVTAPWKDFGTITPLPISIIAFADSNVKTLCVSKWDTNGDGEMSVAEAEAVTNLENVFQDNKSFTSFNELQYFTGLTAINENEFSGCANLTSLEIPRSIVSVGKNAFTGTGWYNSQLNGIIYVGKVAYSYKGTMPSNTSINIKDQTVSISDNAFKVFRNLRSVSLPESLENIGDSAFYNTGLTTITIPANVIHIGKNAFDGCTSLYNIKVNENNTVYDSRDNCRALIETGTNTLIKASSNAEIPATVTTIGPAAFSDCGYKSSLVIPASVTSIEDYALANTRIEDYYIYPSALPEVAENTFYNVDLSVATIHVPLDLIESYKSQAPWSFFGSIVPLSSSIIRFADANVKAICVSLWDTDGDGELSISEAEAVTNIEAINNKNITSFNELQYFTGLISIGNYAFNDCAALTSIVIPNNVKTIGQGLFAGCESLKSIVLSSSMESIESYTFSGCQSLTNVVISNSITYIGRSAFYGCTNLTSIVIPDNIDFISPDAFDGCSSLQSVCSLSMNPNSVSFSDQIYDNATLYVPEGCIEIYRNTDGWKEFRNILSYDPAGVSKIARDAESDAVKYYDLTGKRLDAIQSGIIIIRYGNDKTRKIIID